MRDLLNPPPFPACRFVPLALLLLGLFGCGGGGGGGGGDSASVTAVSDSYIINNPGDPLNIPAPGVLQNDSGSGLTAQLENGPPTLTLNANGSFSYTGSTTATSFTYRARNGTASATATVTISINQPPVANNACNNTGRGIAASGFLSATDPEGAALTYALASGGTSGLSDGKKGNVTINSATGAFTYTPCSAPGTPSCVPATSGTGFQGMDKFTFRVTDPLSKTSTGVVTVLIDGAVRVMPLGDSITQGVEVGGTGCAGSSCPPGPQRIAYRKNLYDNLEALSPAYAVRMVGGLANGSAAGLASPNDMHEGHSGWCAGPNGANPSYCGPINLADNVENWLNLNPADIILLHAGTNSFTTSPNDMSLLLDRIDSWQASNHPVTVFLARIIKNVAGTDNVQLFNDQVAAMVAGRPNNRVILVDQQTGAGITYTIGVDMGDDSHPNASGYNKMGIKWFTDITNPANVGSKFIGLPSCP